MSQLEKIDGLQKGERTQLEIVEAAHKLFLERGYAATSMRQIAESAGIAVGGIYNHFAKKEDIFAAVLEAYHPYKDILPILTNAEGETIEEYAHNAAKGMIDALGKRPDFLNLMFIEVVEFRAEHIPGVIAHIFPQALGMVQGFMQKKGDLRPIPVPVIMRAFIGLFLSYYITEVLMAGVMPPEMSDHSLDHFVDIFLHGILAE